MTRAWANGVYYVPLESTSCSSAFPESSAVQDSMANIIRNSTVSGAWRAVRALEERDSPEMFSGGWSPSVGYCRQQ